MSKTPYHINLPEEIVTELNLHPEQSFHLTLRNGSLTLHPINGQNEIQTLSLRHFLVPSVLAALLFIGYAFYQREFQLPLGGDNSIASAVILLGEMSGMLSFW